MTGERRISANQPIVFPDGTMQYQFRDFIARVDEALVESSLQSVWGQISGTLSNQTDLQIALDAKVNNGDNATVLGSGAAAANEFFKADGAGGTLWDVIEAINVSFSPTPRLLSTNTQDAIAKLSDTKAEPREYLSGNTYYVSDMVYEDGWLMIANKTTTQDPVPQETGNPSWASELYGTLNLLAQTESNVSAYYSGNAFTFENTISLKAYRWYCPDVTGTIDYDIWGFEDDGSLYQLASNLTPTEEGWQEVPVSGLYAEGRTLGIVVVAKSITQPDTFSSTWQTTNANGNPSSGEARFQNNQTEVRISNTDSTSTNQEAQLALIDIGAELTVNGLTWTVTNITTTGSGGGGRHNFFIQPNQGRPVEDDQLLSWTWGSTTPLPYMEDIDFYSGTIISGFKGEIWPPATENANAYGVDVLGDVLSLPSDWELYGLPSRLSIRAQANDSLRIINASSYTVKFSDVGKVLRFTGISPMVTLPTGFYFQGKDLWIRQAGTGTLSLDTTGLTINGTLPTWAQHVELHLRNVGLDEWDVV